MSDRQDVGDDDAGRAAALWRELTAWLAEHAPASAACLRPGAGEEALARVEARMGFALDAGLREVWAVNDGVADDDDSGAGLFLDRHALLPVATAADIHDDLCDSFDEEWGRLWLPLTTNEVNEPWMGSTIDCGSGRLGAWSMEDAPEEPGGMSFVDLLAAVVEAVKDGRGALMPSPGRSGTVPGLADGALVWQDPGEVLVANWAPLR
ncbi:hypothetical protein ABT096_20880 [Streptomyces sp. NPDC002561]|uniref:hypothetical protein n=1 Tax=Streptomyces sp. NPDC002561 TaxID=3154418 RepID=UPI00331FD29D